MFCVFFLFVFRSRHCVRVLLTHFSAIREIESIVDELARVYKTDDQF